MASHLGTHGCDKGSTEASLSEYNYPGRTGMLPRKRIDTTEMLLKSASKNIQHIEK